MQLQCENNNSRINSEHPSTLSAESATKIITSITNKFSPVCLNRITQNCCWNHKILRHGWT